jgi:hypothetical protein
LTHRPIAQFGPNEVGRQYLIDPDVVIAHPINDAFEWMQERAGQVVEITEAVEGHWMGTAADTFGMTGGGYRIWLKELPRGKIDD